MMDRIEEYGVYHSKMLDIGDVDPSNAMLRYVADRFELNPEQKLWICFLYATNYCGPTTFFMYNEFPDFENVDFGRMERWWKANRDKVIFQTDRAWIRSRNQFVDVVRSYSDMIRPAKTQQRFFNLYKHSDPQICYDLVYNAVKGLYQFGRFSLFLYLDVINAVTGYPMEPSGLDLAEAESSRNGLCYVLGRDELLTGHDYGRTRLNRSELKSLQSDFKNLMSWLKGKEPRSTVWNVETSLCAFKKVQRGKRYLGYYIDRQGKEIAQAKSLVTEGVDWSVLDDFRNESYNHKLLTEMKVAERKPISQRDLESLKRFGCQDAEPNNPNCLNRETNEFNCENCDHEHPVPQPEQKS